MAEEEWFATQSGSEGPCSGVRVCPPSLLSIIKSFYCGGDTEKRYCFYKLHQLDGVDPCNRIEVSNCVDTRDGNGAVRLYCANMTDDLSSVIDGLVDEMWEIMSLEDRVVSVNVEIMKQDIKNRLGFIQFVKNNNGHTTRGNASDPAVSYIVIDVGRTLNDETVLEFGETHGASGIITHNVMRPLYIGDLLFALTKKQTSQDKNNVEIMLKAILIHELRHVWQHLQFGKSNTRSMEISGWFGSVDGQVGNIDIMSEVDAYDFQRDFEESKFPCNVRYSDYTNKFRRAEGNDDVVTRQKVNFLWADRTISYKDKKIKGTYIFRNQYGLNR
jgi:hypothetical protein